MKMSRFRFFSRCSRPGGRSTEVMGRVGVVPPAPRCLWRHAARPWALGALLATGWLWFPSPSGNETLAFPPAPHHLVYGQVRDEFGNPFHVTGATVLLDVEGGSTVSTTVVPGQAPGVNYQLTVPVDTGATAALYKPTALRPTVPFRMRVRVGTMTYLPLEMTGAAALLTQPAETTRVDLTLGVDSDNDGLPDSWEQALIQALEGDGVTRTLADIKPEDDADGDGLTNREEYLAGTYAFDPKNGFALEILEVTDGRPLLEFTAVRGRSYTLYGSPDMKDWSRYTFQLENETESAEEHTFYQASQVRRLRIRANPSEEGQEAARFFKVQVQ